VAVDFGFYAGENVMCMRGDGGTGEKVNLLSESTANG